VYNSERYTRFRLDHDANEADKYEICKTARGFSETDLEKKFAPYIGDRRLNIGCGASIEDGWVNMDFNPQGRMWSSTTLGPCRGRSLTLYGHSSSEPRPRALSR